MHPYDVATLKHPICERSPSLGFPWNSEWNGNILTFMFNVVHPSSKRYFFFKLELFKKTQFFFYYVCCLCKMTPRYILCKVYGVRT